MWHTELWKDDLKRTWQFAMGDGFVAGAEEFLDDDLLGMDYGRLFAYMYRRFGVPECGSDDYKEIANWYLATPDAAVLLVVSPRPLGAQYSFSHGLNTEVFTDWREQELRDRAINALRVTVRDLLVPTNVRDTYINAMGPVAETVTKEVQEAVAYSPHAGLGVEAEYFQEREAKEGEFLFKRKGA